MRLCSWSLPPEARWKRRTPGSEDEVEVTDDLIDDLKIFNR